MKNWADTEKSIIRCGNITDGWSNKKPSEKVTQRAILLAKCIFNLIPDCHAMPGTGGSIEVIFAKDDHFLIFDVRPDLSIELTYEKGIGHPYDLEFLSGEDE